MAVDTLTDTIFPQQPFERIAIALSGGGFRATTYNLGVLSMLHAIQLTEGNVQPTLLDKVTYGSSTSGGTITLSVFAACVRKGIRFEQFYRHLNSQLYGESLVHEAIRLIQDENTWKGVPKSRNFINAFSKVYHDKLFGVLGPDNDRTMATLLAKDQHLQEVCFNATEFFTGIPFKFQVSSGWDEQRGGRIGNNNIRINRDNPQAVSTLERLRLSDVLACSSCFPTGFEPMVFPKDFTYAGGPSVQDFEEAVDLRTYSTARNQEADPRSKRAEKEKAFAEKGSFSIMDGGIVDNQGLDALTEANDRKDGADASGNRFDLVMVCDVASFYMDPYTNPEIDMSKSWMRTTLLDYWNTFRNYAGNAVRVMRTATIVAIVVAILCVLPLLLIERGIAEWALAILGFALLGGVLWLRSKTKSFTAAHSAIAKWASYATPAALIQDKLPAEKSFQNRVLGKVTTFAQDLPTGVLLQMLLSRVQSSQVMIGEIFLKHVRRLIFDHFYYVPKLRYRRLNNVIYKLTFTNDVNRRHPRFEDQDDGTDDMKARKAAFLAEWDASKKLTVDMQRVAELAYNTGTTLWFEAEQENEDPFKNNRRALLAAGQFTTCSNLLGYALSLKHSKHFASIDTVYQQRVLLVIDQLKKYMEQFSIDPFWLEKTYNGKAAVS